MPKKTVVSGPPFVSPHGYGTCFCGCGGKAPVADKSDARRGYVGGYPKRYIPGHQRRKYIPGYEVDEASGCWNWTGAISDQGYARTGAQQMMHRVYWSNANGEIPPGMQIHHKCFNRRCVNPEHLELASPGENSRASAKVLNWEKARWIREQLGRGRTAVEVAREMGVNVLTVRSVGQYASWREPLCCPNCQHEFEPWDYSRRKPGAPKKNK